MTIQILIGISGAGKSTYSQQFIDDYVRINRDDLRRTFYMMSPGDNYYSHPDFKQRENLITQVTEQIMYDALNQEKNVLLDNTHLQLKYIKDILRKFNHLADIEIKFFDIPLKEAKERVGNRDSIQDLDYINRQFNEYNKLREQLKDEPLFHPQTNPHIEFDQSLPKTYIFDIDGNLALKGDRDIFDDNKLHLDTEITPVGETLRALYNQGYKVIFLSGRQDSCREQTEQWLRDNNLWMEDSEMFMRKAKDQRCDSIVKEELLREFIVPKYNVIGVFDDRLRVNRTWYKLGVFCFNTNQNLIQF